ncbi:hypothetical protein LXL04_000393 [Taraxacum kok-saghyz]
MSLDPYQTDCMSVRIPPERLPLLIGHELDQNHSQRMLVQVRTIIKFENGGTNLARYKSHLSYVWYLCSAYACVTSAPNNLKGTEAQVVKTNNLGEKVRRIITEKTVEDKFKYYGIENKRLNIE